jgi:outer membrane lipoprotein-sorting protein
MTLFARRPALRWFVPVVLALLLAGGGTAIGVLTAAARGGLPPRTAAQLLVDVQKARVTGLSGTIVQTADLGLPSIPGAGGSGSSDLTSLVSGSHTLRLWYAGPNRVRLAVQGSLGESDVVRRGTDLWIWSSADKTASHHVVPLTKKSDTPDQAAGTLPMTPQQAADQALKAISPTTKVSTDGTASVAGRSAYELVLTPRSASTLVDSVHIAIDGRTHVPLRVQVFAKGLGKPALEVGFTSFDPSTPGSSVFGFNPPPGTKVTQSGADAKTPGTAHQAPPSGKAPKAASTEPTVVGSGWTTVAVTRLPSDAVGQDRTISRLVGKLPAVNGAWGSGHLLRGTLFSAVLTDDGRLAIGAVAPEALYRALAK